MYFGNRACAMKLKELFFGITFLIWLLLFGFGGEELCNLGGSKKSPFIFIPKLSNIIWGNFHKFCRRVQNVFQTFLKRLSHLNSLRFSKGLHFLTKWAAVRLDQVLFSIEISMFRNRKTYSKRAEI